MHRTQPALVRHPGAGRVVEIGPTRNLIKIAGADTHRTMGVIELDLNAGFDGPPIHWHRRVTHLWYVLTGLVRATIDGDEHLLEPGACALVPAGIPHGFANGGDETARFLEVDLGGALDGYYDDLARALPPGASVDRTLVAAIQADHDTFPPENLEP
jgi:quercetin dioxygenase-like cupin family protein